MLTAGSAIYISHDFVCEIHLFTVFWHVKVNIRIPRGNESQNYDPRIRNDPISSAKRRKTANFFNEIFEF